MTKTRSRWPTRLVDPTKKTQVRSCQFKLTSLCKVLSNLTRVELRLALVTNQTAPLLRKVLPARNRSCSRTATRCCSSKRRQRQVRKRRGANRMHLASPFARWLNSVAPRSLKTTMKRVTSFRHMRILKERRTTARCKGCHSKTFR